MSNTSLFTSESVGEGHPDKVADQVSDAVLDGLLAQDPGSRVACETLVTTGLVVIAGEITTRATVNFAEIARHVIADIGYNSSEIGFDANTCGIIVSVGRQSPDIAQGVNEGEGLDLEQGAGDQGLMFGYACDETAVLMPASIHYSHRLVERQSQVRRSGLFPWLRPDAKAQVTVRYENDAPVAVEAVVLSTQHGPEVSYETLREGVVEEIIKPVFPAAMLTPATQYYVNPTGRFVIGGPMGDCGLTGRKIIVDTYGGHGAHGGGAFSGKDPSKVDRSSAYMGRYLAKNVVASGLAKRCLIQVAYAIGVAKPVSMMVNTFGTGRLADARITALIQEHFDLRPKAIIQQLNLLRPIYRQTAAYGHFGRELPDFTWERTDKAQALAQAAGL